ncbi:MAG: acyl carrier protein [Desulfatirhabdiaceae bacterium]
MMTNEQMLAWIADVFEASKEKIHPELSRDEIATWDSLGTLTLLSRLDEDLDICLSENEISELKKIQDIIEILIRHNKIMDS